MKTFGCVLIAMLLSTASMAQPRADATLRVTVVDPSGAVIVGARVTLTPYRSPDGERTADTSTTGARGDAMFTALEPGTRHDSRRVARLRAGRRRATCALRAGDNRREVKLKIAKLAETVQVGRDPRERASDPRGDAFATVLDQAQIDELPDDPDEMEQVLQRHGRARRGAARERLPRRPAAAEGTDPADPLPPQHVRRRHPRAGLRLDRHHDQAGHRQLARLDQPRLPQRRRSARATRSRRSKATSSTSATAFSVSGPLWKQHTSLAVRPTAPTPSTRRRSSRRCHPATSPIRSASRTTRST